MNELEPQNAAEAQALEDFRWDQVCAKESCSQPIGDVEPVWVCECLNPSCLFGDPYHPDCVPAAFTQPEEELD